MRVALVHDWLINMGGAERVLEELARMFPEAPIYVGVVDPTRLSPLLRTRQIIPSLVQRWPFAIRWYNRYLPLLAYGFEQFDLSSYDLVISSSAAVAKGVVTRAETCHISYVHTPMRYAWDLYHEYHTREAKGLTRKFMGPVFHYLRLWDRVSTDRVDVLVANSSTVAQRIQKHYRRSAVVVHPPVSIDQFRIADHVDDYYLVLSRLVSYKRFDLAVEAANRLGRRLIVAGSGPELPHLKRIAKGSVQFVGSVNETKRAELMAHARALLFPGEEDFGIAPVESQAAGRPVIAYGRGGVQDTVIPEQTGILFSEQTVDALIEAMLRAEAMVWDSDAIRRNALRFGPEAFRRDFQRLVAQAMAKHRPKGSQIDANGLT
ncbi:MAG: glycosyltransferase family 4 protein [Sulfobacillus benefaciens]|uniref:Glycosyltransferase family 4 protein n=1 Tax=Sulfobacillus benefaciens TaxID=453960 RepID=A0A2T2XIS1_9FIRM|nr:MAG: glycosyltransferase family 4 protein [Sulfobacillus benefaciens]